MGVTPQDQVLTGLPEKFIRMKIETDKTFCNLLQITQQPQVN